MPSAQELKNVTKTGKAVIKAATDIKEGLSFFKALTHGENSKISNWSAFFMLTIALCLDIAQAIVGIFDAGYISAPVALVLQLAIFSLWFLLKGLSYWGKRQIASKAITSLVEIVGGWIPWLSTIVPSSTIMVAAAIGIIRMEEAGAKTDQDGKNADKSGDKSEQNPDNVVQFKRRELAENIKTPARENVYEKAA